MNHDKTFKALLEESTKKAISFVKILKFIWNKIMTSKARIFNIAKLPNLRFLSAISGFATILLFVGQVNAAELYVPPLSAESQLVMVCKDIHRYRLYEPDGTEHNWIEPDELELIFSRWSEVDDSEHQFAGAVKDKECGSLWDYLAYIDAETYVFYEYQLEFGAQPDP